jgi:hypothetical protein
MYRHSQSALGLSTLAGGALHTGGLNLIWTTVLAATVAGAAITIGHIALGLGLAHPRNLSAGLRRRFSNNSQLESTPTDS